MANSQDISDAVVIKRGYTVYDHEFQGFKPIDAPKAMNIDARWADSQYSISACYLGGFVAALFHMSIPYVSIQ